MYQRKLCYRLSRKNNTEHIEEGTRHIQASINSFLITPLPLSCLFLLDFTTIDQVVLLR